MKKRTRAETADVAGIRRELYQRDLTAWQSFPPYPYMRLMVAICQTMLDDYSTARETYKEVVGAMLRERDWERFGDPHFLVDAFILSGERKQFLHVLQKIEVFRLGSRGDALLAAYAFALVRLLSGRDYDADDVATELLKRPKIKVTYAMGEAVRALVEHDQGAFDSALNDLLSAHRGMAKFGGLRETPERFLCLPAMSLSKLALERGLEVNSDSEYLSMGYLSYLLKTVP